MKTPSADIAFFVHGSWYFSQMDTLPIIVTLELDESSAAWLTELRSRYFPPERNYLDAHLTLFHDLPDSERESVVATIEHLASQYKPLELTFVEPMHLGFGVAIRVANDYLTSIHQQLQDAFSIWLKPQDQQPLRPHVTIQNKVAAATSKSLFQELKQSWQARQGKGLGFQLWHYAGGPWNHLTDIRFQD